MDKNNNNSWRVVFGNNKTGLVKIYKGNSLHHEHSIEIRFGRVFVKYKKSLLFIGEDSSGIEPGTGSLIQISLDIETLVISLKS